MQNRIDDDVQHKTVADNFQKQKVDDINQHEKKIFRIGVHLRYVDGETLEFIPATGVGKGHSIEEASNNAIKKAVSKLVNRLD